MPVFVPVHGWIYIFTQVVHWARCSLCLECKAPTLLLTLFHCSDNKWKFLRELWTSQRAPNSLTNYWPTERGEVNAIELWNHRKKHQVLPSSLDISVTKHLCLRDHLFISHEAPQYIWYGTTYLVINYITPIWVQCTFECTHAHTHALQCQALLWLLHHATLILPSCFPHAFHHLTSPMGPIISCRSHFISSLQVSFVCVFTCACLLLSIRDRQTRDRVRGSLFCRVKSNPLYDFLTVSFLSYQSVVVLFRRQGVRCQSQLLLTLSDCGPVRSCW